MAKVILVCGRLCSGKSTYSRLLCHDNKAILLSVDEITLLFGQYLGDRHDEIVAATQKYLYDKSVQLINCGVDVVLDWGFWTKADRDTAVQFYSSCNIPYEFHYIDISDEEWQRRLDKRNCDVLAGETEAYYVDENLAAKFAGRFEKPSSDEIDVWVRQQI